MSCLFVCSHWMDFYEIWYLNILQKSVEKIQVSLNSDKNNGYIAWRPIYIFDQFVLEWEMLQIKVVEKIKTHIFSQNFAIYETKQKNSVESDSPPITVWCMHIACWMYKATNTQSEYVILTACPLQEWLHLCTSVLQYMYTACLVMLDQNPRLVCVRIQWCFSFIILIWKNCVALCS